MSGLGSVLNMLSALADGGNADRRQVVLSCNGEKFTLPVTLGKYEVTSGQKNKVVDIEQVGEALIFGMPEVRKLSLECFFPYQDHDYPFVVGDDKSPAECVELLTKWKESRKPVRIVITDTPVNLMMGIMSFDYNEHDGSKDIYFKLSMTEYKDLNTPPANNDKAVDSTTGLKERASSAQHATSVTLQKGADVLDAAKKAYGQYNKWRRIVSSNSLKDLVLNNAGKLRKLKVKKW